MQRILKSIILMLALVATTGLRAQTITLTPGSSSLSTIVLCPLSLCTLYIAPLYIVHCPFVHPFAFRLIDIYRA